jgi:hypothetical protein
MIEDILKLSQPKLVGALWTIFHNLNEENKYEVLRDMVVLTKPVKEEKPKVEENKPEPPKRVAKVVTKEYDPGKSNKTLRAAARQFSLRPTTKKSKKR